MKILLAAAIAAGVSACASPQLETRDQWLAESQRVYRDRDPEQVIRAAEAVLNAADPGDITFAHTTDGFTAQRQWLIYVVIASAVGTNTYEFKATPGPDGTHATIRIDQRTNTGNGNTTEGAIGMIASYRLFFNWLDYALGKGNTWITCDRAEVELSIANAGMAAGLCAPGITARGASPVQPKPEWTRPSKAAATAAVHSRDLLRARGSR